MDQNTNFRFNRAEYRDKVFGCWFGKSIGGTLGGPYEWSETMNHVTFYPPEINGMSLPNDDLDLQLVWLAAAERYGRDLNERHLAEYWSEFITGPWNEYGVCRNNIRLGLTPPLSGSCGNDIWKWSNGAWIRSEIWACLYPGNPAAAARAAYCDACCDHTGEGIYAEIFTAALESAAFAEKEIRNVIEIALAFLPEGSRIARAVKLAVSSYDKGLSLAEAREAVIQDSSDLGLFQAPGNIGFTILGLIYGEGDFGKSVCYAVNCGDDADCTGGTAGAVMGILLGKEGIPQKWRDPIGERILTCSIENTMRKAALRVPRDLSELTDRTILCAERFAQDDPDLPGFTDGESRLPSGMAGEEILKSFRYEMSMRRPYELAFDLPWGVLSFEFPEGPYVEDGKTLSVIVRCHEIYSELMMLSLEFQAPEGWRADSGVFAAERATLHLSITAGEVHDAVTYLPVTVRRHDRLVPATVYLPLLKKEQVDLNDHRRWPEGNFFQLRDGQRGSRYDKLLKSRR